MSRKNDPNDWTLAERIVRASRSVVPLLLQLCYSDEAEQGWVLADVYISRVDGGGWRVRLRRWHIVSHEREIAWGAASSVVGAVLALEKALRQDAWKTDRAYVPQPESRYVQRSSLAYDATQREIERRLAMKD